MATTDVSAKSNRGKRPWTIPGEPLEFLLSKALPFKDTQTCLIWPYAKSTDGYGCIVIDGRRCIVSRLVCESTHGPSPTDTHQAAHDCGNSSCCNPTHIRWKTPKENCADKIIHGTNVGNYKPKFGESNGRSLLTRDQVMAIRGSTAEPRRKLADRYGVSVSTIAAIRARQNWTWL
jgi:hypothetical protein